MVPSGRKLENLCPPPNLGRGLSLGLAFIVFGSVACMSGLALLIDDNDPRSAFALAIEQPEQPASRGMIAATAAIGQAAVDTAEQKAATAEGPPPCRSDADGNVNAGCATAAGQETGTVHADAPARAETAAPPAVPEQVRLLASTPALTEETVKSEDAPASVPVLEPAVPEAAPPQAAEASPAKPQKAQRRQSRPRNAFGGFPLFALDQRGRLRFRPLF